MSFEADYTRRVRNALSGKFASGGFLGEPYYPGEMLVFDHRPGIGFVQRAKKATIPALDVPTAPKEPEAAPESASVQMLRALMADRVAEKERVEAAVKSRDKQIEDAQRRIDELTKRNDDDRRHIGAAVAAIAAVEVDIAKLTN